MRKKACVCKGRRRPDGKGEAAPRHVVVVSDLHAGCKLGLCPPAGCQLDDGGIYLPSAAQRKVWAMWEEFWGEFVPRATKGERYGVVINGDAVEGTHHRASTPISHNLEDQIALAEKILAPIAERADGNFWAVRGTEAHVGISAREEEALYRRLGARRDRDGKYCRWELWLRVGGHLVHFLHHIGTTSSSAHEASAVNAEVSAAYNEAARWGEEPPAVVVRSHRHRFIEVRIPTARGFTTSTVTPGWQLKTPFTWKIAGGRLSPPQFGGIVITAHEDGVIFTQPKVWHIGRTNEAHLH